MDQRHADLLTDIVEEACAALAPSRRGEWIARVAGNYETAKRAAESAGTAKRAGTWYTPETVVASVLDASMPARPAAGFRACDPSCGTGNFLSAIAARLDDAGWSAARIAKSLEGMDLDPMAVAIARVRLRHEVGGTAAAWRAAVRCGDSLAADSWEGRRFALVAGNPPFLGQLEAGSARSASERAALEKRFGGAVTRYADIAAAFLMLGTELAPRGTVALLQPMSTLSASDALGVRRACEDRLALVAVLLPPARSFGAAVHTCVPVLSARAARDVCVIDAEGHEHRVARSRTRHGAWGAALAAARGVPDPHIRRATATLDAWMRATADFRQHYYGLKGRIIESRGAKPSSRRPSIVTVGAIAAARLEWGTRPVRIHGTVFRAPTVDTDAIRSDRVLGPWLAARRGPKVLVATQTRAIEAWIDEQGTSLPSTPAITVTPKKAGDLWKVGAALLAPPVAAEAWWRHAGAGLSVTAIRVSASQLRDLPAPGDPRAWKRGATLLAEWQRTQHAAAREKFAEAMCDAYGVPAGAARATLLAWWRSSIGAAP